MRTISYGEYSAVQGVQDTVEGRGWERQCSVEGRVQGRVYSVEGIVQGAGWIEGRGVPLSSASPA
jgi:hypothetical protein